VGGDQRNASALILFSSCRPLGGGGGVIRLVLVPVSFTVRPTRLCGEYAPTVCPVLATGTCSAPASASASASAPVQHKPSYRSFLRSDFNNWLTFDERHPLLHVRTLVYLCCQFYLYHSSFHHDILQHIQSPHSLQNPQSITPKVDPPPRPKASGSNNALAQSRHSGQTFQVLVVGETCPLVTSVKN